MEILKKIWEWLVPLPPQSTSVVEKSPVVDTKVSKTSKSPRKPRANTKSATKKKAPVVKSSRRGRPRKGANDAE